MEQKIEIENDLPEIIDFELYIRFEWNALGTACHGNDYDGIVNTYSLRSYTQREQIKKGIFILLYVKW